MRPKLSYIIWFSQRTGSTLLCKALESTGVAGKPGELLWNNAKPGDLWSLHAAQDHAELQARIWAAGQTKNGVFGLKYGIAEPYHSEITGLFRDFPSCPVEATDAEVWAYAFPSCRHIFMTRRNKVRLAVSWWKAIKSTEWHRQAGDRRTGKPVSDEDYVFAAIDRLYAEASMREAETQEFFSAAGIVPLTVVYEDFIADYEATVKRVLRFLDLPLSGVKVAAPFYEKLADSISESWVERFRRERTASWR